MIIPAILHALHSSGSPTVCVAVSHTNGSRDEALESLQNRVSCRGWSQEFLEFDITSSQLVVYWSECQPKTGPLVVIHWWTTAAPTSLSSQKGLCVRYMKFSACGPTLQIFSSVKDAVKVAKKSLQYSPLLYLSKLAVPVHTYDSFCNANKHLNTQQNRQQTLTQSCLYLPCIIT